MRLACRTAGALNRPPSSVGPELRAPIWPRSVLTGANSSGLDRVRRANDASIRVLGGVSALSRERLDDRLGESVGVLASAKWPPSK
jgi:hypothetical protein